MNKSIRAKRRLLNLTYRSLNDEYEDQVTIKRDPLARRYEVNRFCVSIIHDAKTPKEIINFIESVMTTRYPDSKMEKDGHGYTLNLGGLVYHMTIKTANNEEWLDVGVY